MQQILWHFRISYITCGRNLLSYRMKMVFDHLIEDNCYQIKNIFWHLEFCRNGLFSLLQLSCICLIFGFPESRLRMKVSKQAHKKIIICSHSLYLLDFVVQFVDFQMRMKVGEEWAGSGQLLSLPASATDSTARVGRWGLGWGGAGF